MVVGELSSLTFSVQWMKDSQLEPLSSLVNLRELSLRGAVSINGTGLAYLSGLSHLQVRDYIS